MVKQSSTGGVLRTIVQIAVAENIIVALADDGSLWKTPVHPTRNQEWYKLPNLPHRGDTE